MRSKWFPHIALMIANLIYGLNYDIAKFSLPVPIPPFAYIVLRVGLAGALFWILHASTVKEKIQRKDILLLAFCGFFGVFANQMLFFWGLSETYATNASIIMISAPIVVLTLSAALGKELLTWRKSAGIALGAIGAFILLGFSKEFSFGSSTAFGDFLIFLNAASYSTYLVIVKPLMQKYNPITIIKWVFTFGFIPVILIGGFQLDEIAWSDFTNVTWFSLGFVILGTTFLAYLLNIFALRQVPPSIVSVYIYSQPVIAAIFAAFLGTDTLDARKLVAAILIGIGVFLTSVKKKQLNSKPKVKSA